jgi:mycoredoxin
MRGVPFEDFNINQDAEAEQFVIYINGGFRSTPTIIFDVGKVKLVLTEPSNARLDEALAQAGFVEEE